LFSMDSLDLRPKSQDIYRSFKFNCWRFVLTCFYHVSIWEIWCLNLFLFYFSKQFSQINRFQFLKLNNEGHYCIVRVKTSVESYNGY
jgi:hypothetical protein